MLYKCEIVEFALCRVEVTEHHNSIEEVATFPQFGKLVLRSKGITRKSYNSL